MLETAFRTYQKRKIININVNVTVAGLLAIAVAKLPVHWVSEWLGPDRRWLIVIAAALIDGIADIIIYYALHWIANHWRPLRKGGSKVKGGMGEFFKHASLVQFERYMLSPVFYIVAMGLMYVLAEFTTMRDSWAFVVGFTTAILTTRVLHTMIGLRTGTFKDGPPTVEQMARVEEGPKA